MLKQFSWLQVYFRKKKHGSNQIFSLSCSVWEEEFFQAPPAPVETRPPHVKSRSRKCKPQNIIDHAPKGSRRKKRFENSKKMIKVTRCVFQKIISPDKWCRSIPGARDTAIQGFFPFFQSIFIVFISACFLMSLVGPEELTELDVSNFVNTTMSMFATLFGDNEKMQVSPCFRSFIQCIDLTHRLSLYLLMFQTKNNKPAVIFPYFVLYARSI